MSERRRPHGGLRSRILELLWDDGGATAKEIQTKFDGDEQVPALSTILTVLERLRKSGEVIRTPGESGEFVYSPTPSQTSDAVELMLQALTKSSDRSDVLLGFAGSLDARDLDTLRRALGESARDE